MVLLLFCLLEAIEVVNVNPHSYRQCIHIVRGAYAELFEYTANNYKESSDVLRRLSSVKYSSPKAVQGLTL